MNVEDVEAVSNNNCNIIYELQLLINVCIISKYNTIC